MKRMITIAAALFVAAAVQAASIDWAITGVGAVKDKSNTNVGAGWTVYLVNVDQLSLITSAISDGTFSSSTAGVLDERTTNAQSNLAAIPATDSSLVAGTSYQYAVLVFNEAYTGAMGSTGDYKISLFSPSTPAYTLGVDSPTQVTFTGGGDMASGTWYNYTVVIPEPTAMALLALGAAAFGLRRRFRK